MTKEWYKDDDGPFSYPLTPEKGAAKIVAMLLSDLPLDRQKSVRDAIEEWASEREHAVTSFVQRD